MMTTLLLLAALVVPARPTSFTWQGRHWVISWVDRINNADLFAGLTIPESQLVLVRTHNHDEQDMSETLYHELEHVVVGWRFTDRRVTGHEAIESFEPMVQLLGSNPQLTAYFTAVWPPDATMARPVRSDPDDDRRYWPVTVPGMAHNFHTHVQVIGRVTEVARQKDDDLHIRIEADGGFIVAECIPELPCRVTPKLNDCVRVRGISRFDGEHKWWEVHPIEAIWVENCKGKE